MHSSFLAKHGAERLAAARQRFEHARTHLHHVLSDEIRVLEAALSGDDVDDDLAVAWLPFRDEPAVPHADFAKSPRQWLIVPGAIHVLNSYAAPRTKFANGYIPSGLSRKIGDAICTLVQVASDGHVLGPQGGAKWVRVDSFFEVRLSNGDCSFHNLEAPFKGVSVTQGSHRRGSGSIITLRCGWRDLADAKAWFSDHAEAIEYHRSLREQRKRLGKELARARAERDALREVVSVTASHSLGS